MTETESFTYLESLNRSTEYFNGDNLAAKVFIDKYALRDREGAILEDTPDKMHRRLSKEFARIEKKYPNPMSEDEIFKLIDRFEYIILQGSPMSAIGNPYHIQSSGNCFSIEPPYDSYGGIFYTDQQLGQLMKRRCGVGLCLNNLRPKGVPVRNAAKTTDGIGVFMERFSNTCREVAQNGRRGAEILLLSVHHPEVRTFMNIKKDRSKVTGANISIQVTDKFLNAVKKGDDFELRWPIDSEEPSISQKVSAKEIWGEFINSSWESAEPGILFWDTVLKNSVSNNYGKIDKNFYDTACNPCLTGDTLVYTADGRGDVSIKILAEEGKDVPVFCYDDNGKKIIRKMRNPRITGLYQKIYKITLEEGYSIRATGNHKIRMSNGEYKQVKDIKYGDSVKTLTKFEASLKDIFPKCNSNSQNYLWLSDGGSANISEHRLIASYNYGRNIKKGEVVHHNDKNTQNNCISNLKIITKKDHDILHFQDMIGKKNPYYKMSDEWKFNFASHPAQQNPRYSNLTHLEIREYALKLTKEQGRKFTYEEWNKYAKKHKIPMNFSLWRKQDLGTISDLSEWAAKKCEFGNYGQTVKNIKTYKKAINEGYNAFIKDGKVCVKRYCEYCNKAYSVLYKRREVSYCSQKCGSAKYSLNKAKENKYNQLLSFTKLKQELNREPLIKEWMEECKKNKIPYRLKTKNSFSNYKELKKEAEVFNHRVISVEEDGYETVYNGTVDDFHNFFIGGFKAKTKSNKDKFLYINNLQCGEIVMGADSCRLLALNLYSFVENKFTKQAFFNFEKFSKYVQKAQRMMDDMVDLEIELIKRILKKIEVDPEPENVKQIEKETWTNILKVCKKGRRTGLGITGLADTLASLNICYGSKKSIKVTDEIYCSLATNAYLSTCILAKERGAFPIFSFEIEKDNIFINRVLSQSEKLQKLYKKYGRRNVALTTTPPAGSISLLARVSSGMEPVFSIAGTRRKKIHEGDKEVKVDFIDHMGDKWQEFEVYHKGFKDWMEVTNKTEIKDSPYSEASAKEIDWIASVDIQAAAQKWVCHSISKTCNLPSDVTKEEVERIYLRAWEKGCKGFTIYREGCRTGVLIDKSKQKEEEIHRITKTKAPKRPKLLPCDIHNTTVKGEKYFVIIGLLNGEEPYEVFAGKKDNFNNSTKEMVLKKLKRGQYVICRIENEEEIIYDNISKSIDEDQEAITRLISSNLRHGCDMEFVVHQLEKTKGDLMGFAKAICRVLKKYIKEGAKVHGENCPDCGGELKRQEGCVACSFCGFSKCG